MSTEIDPRIVREVAEAAFRSTDSGSPAERVEAALIASGVAGPVVSEKFDAYTTAVGAEYDRLADEEMRSTAEQDADLAEVVVRLQRWLAGRQGKVHSKISTTNVIAEPRDRSTAAWAIAELDVAAVVAVLEARIAKAGE